MQQKKDSDESIGGGIKKYQRKIGYIDGNGSNSARNPLIIDKGKIQEDWREAFNQSNKFGSPGASHDNTREIVIKQLDSRMANLTKL